MLQLTSMCWMETVLVSTKLMLWCRLGLLEMMCCWFTTLELLGKELCLGEGLSPNALSSCLLPFWSSWFAWLLLYAAWYAVFLEVGWTLCFLKLVGLMGARAIVSGSFLLLVLSLALVGGGLILMDVVLHERCNDSVACSCVGLLLPWLQVYCCWALVY